MMRPFLALLLAAMLALSASAALADASLDARLKDLEEELRCLVCQNQTLADSHAPLAEDLRREVRELAESGKNNAQIKEYLVARYGDFVLYDPPVKATTWLLWFGPFAALAGGGVVWWMILRRRRAGGEDDMPAPSDATGADATRARALLDEHPEI